MNHNFKVTLQLSLTKENIGIEKIKAKLAHLLTQEESLKECCRLLKIITGTEEDDYIVLADRKKQYRIPAAGILFVRAVSNYVHIQMQDKQCFCFAKTLKEVQQLLPAYFWRVHRSFIVNSQAIVHVQKNKLLLTGGRLIPIGKCYKNDIKQLLATNKLQGIREE
ncbi:MAG: hypothetical protein KatS3mg033_1368 [Thermonema sp.]|uniref:LytR/AlgR family response regulator transcription factor n=1 Tax=Thermonema sp. TaxID=2231181 RepID=UPI0021DBCB50|nr:LytTR family DNA-binding domain-containing protein [Thermonema sp.]GIV39568.1 MAG: hypothetical protein KatS3mg033_1368 [Thermonema sp.]